MLRLFLMKLQDFRPATLSLSNTERYSVSLRIYTVSHRIQFECGKIQTRITPNTVTFNAVSKFEILLYVLHKSIKILTKKEI